MRSSGAEGAKRDGQGGEGEPRESRGQERLSGSPASYGGLDLSQEGRISLPTTQAALSRLGLAYKEAAVGICDAALEAAGGRGSAAAADERSVPSVMMEAENKGTLGDHLCILGVDRQRGEWLLRQAVELLRREVRTRASGREQDALEAKRLLAVWLYNLGANLMDQGAIRMVEGTACLREALEQSVDTGCVETTQLLLIHLANMSGRPDLPVGPTEAAELRSRLNALFAKSGRNHDSSCSICLEPLEQPNGGAEMGAVDDGGRTPGGYTNSAVQVLDCAHQFHRGCLSTWWRTRSERRCPLCKA